MKSTFNVPFSPPDISEEEIKEVVDTLRSGWITTGPKTKQFENEIAKFVGVPRAVCLNSATAALELSLHVLGIGPGDEVITSAYTYTASASVIHHVGAKIVLVDTAPNSFEMDYQQMEMAINENTKAIIPVDIGGVMCDYDNILSVIIHKKNLFHPNNDRQKAIGRITIIADAAHSFGAIRNTQKSGQAADITCFSFHAVKNLTTGEGGAIVWTNTFGLTDEILYKEFMLYSLHGQSKDAFSKMQKGAWEYDIIYPAYKNNMTDILSSLGLAQLRRYAKLLERRFEILALYDSLLDKNNVSIINHSGFDFKGSGHLLLCNLKHLSISQRNGIIIKLAETGISTNVHYKPLPILTAYMNLGFNILNFPNAYKKYSNEITLPLHTLLSDEDVYYVASKVNHFVENIYIG